MKLPMILKLTAKAIDVNDIFVDISVAPAPKLRKCCWTHAMLWKRHLHPPLPTFERTWRQCPCHFPDVHCSMESTVVSNCTCLLVYCRYTCGCVERL